MWSNRTVRFFESSKTPSAQLRLWDRMFNTFNVQKNVQNTPGNVDDERREELRAKQAGLRAEQAEQRTEQAGQRALI